ncbi:MAG: BatA domain-containing protein [Flavobacteriia bacterium]|nr:BatA domain-containing protein [Flavobacteriia bacterium]
MKFEHPNVLYFLFFLIIPILIHLFHFRRHKTLYFSNLFFIKKIEEVNRSTKKLKRVIILITRLLAFISIILAFAQPYIPNKQVENGKNLYCFYVDNSYSMALQGTHGELFSMAKERAKKIAEQAERDTRFLLVTNQFDGIEQQILSKADFLENLNYLDYSPLKKSLSDVMQWITDAVEMSSEGNSSTYRVSCFLLSDFQKNNLKNTQWKSSNQLSLYPIQILAQKIENLAVDSIWFDKPHFKKGENNELFIKVKNYSAEDFINVEVGLEINQTKRTALCDIPKNSEKTISIHYTDQELGLKKGRVWINDKYILFDDDFYFSYQVQEYSPILIADGEDAVSNIQSVYSLEKYFKLSQCSQNNFTPDKLNDINLLILNGWNDISDAAITLISEFVTKGGSLAVFPGSKLQLEKWNSFLLKLRLPTFNKLSNTSFKINQIAYQDPFFKGVFETKPQKLLMPLQNKIYPNIASKSSILPLISYENNQVLFLKSLQNAVYLFCSTLHEEAGNFKKNALFSTILLRMSENAIRTYPNYLTIGSSEVFPLQLSSKNDTPVKLKSKDVEFVPQQYKEMGFVYLSVQSSSVQKHQKAGFYDIISDEIKGVLAVNDNREESLITPASKDEINMYFQSLGYNELNYSSLENENELLTLNFKKELVFWRLFIFFAILFIIIELMLLKWWKD